MKSALESLNNQFAVEGEVVTTRTTANGDLTFSIYEFRNASTRFSIALAENDGQVYLIALQGQTDTHEKLVESVFLPAVDAFALH